MAKAKAKQAKQPVQLTQIRKGWFPKITQEAFAKLRKLESCRVGRYSYTVLRHFSSVGKVCFDVAYGMELSSKEGRYIGMFEIDFEKGTIRMMQGGKQLL